MNPIDNYAYTSGWRHTPPAPKALLAVVTLVVCICCASPLSHLFVFVIMSSLTLVRGKIPPGFYGRMLLVPAAFLAMGLSGIAVSVGRTLPGPYPHVQLKGLFLFLTPEGAGHAFRLAAKSMAAVSCLYFLVLSTPVRDITALLAKMKLPGVLVEQMMLIYRFIFLLSGTASIKLKSARCRHAFTSPCRWAPDMGTVWGAVFVQSLDSGKQVYRAMQARGYHTAGQAPLLEPPEKVRFVHMLWIALLQAAIIIINYM